MKKEAKGPENHRHIAPIVKPDWKRVTPSCESCQASCQSACKTSCTVANTPCPEK
ncbi:MAG: six-cysteine ranthipeptide SCIFF [Bacillota bacterium]|jgi:predicted ribosomally synthesized six-cysteine peptide SCIFF